MKKEILKFGITGMILSGALLTFSCGGGSKESAEGEAAPPPNSMVEEADPMDDKGIGPVSSVELGSEIDTDLAKKGEEIYGQMCTACHKQNQDFIGPAPNGVLERRSPEWIMNMNLNPEEMVQKNKDARDLLIKFNGAPMANQNLTEEQARAILEYFRTL